MIVKVTECCINYCFQKSSHYCCIAGNWTWQYSSSQVKNNNAQFLFTYCYCVKKNWKFLAVCRVWAWWPFASVMLTVRFLITWLDNVWEPAPPPPAVQDWVAYLTTLSGLNPQTPLRCHMDLWLACLVLTHLHLHQHQHRPLLQQQTLEPRVSVFLFNHSVFSLAGCLLPF
jgi:hypothetical protein